MAWKEKKLNKTLIVTSILVICLALSGTAIFLSVNLPNNLACIKDYESSYIKGAGWTRTTKPATASQKQRVLAAVKKDYPEGVSGCPTIGITIYNNTETIDASYIVRDKQGFFSGCIYKMNVKTGELSVACPN